jgi:hypothetical protein
VSVQVREVLKLPFSGAGWHRRLGIGAATTLGLEALFATLGYLTAGGPGLELTPLAVGVNLPLLGYALELFRSGLAGDARKLPEWSGWPRLVRQGLRVAWLGLSYGLVPLLLLLGGLSIVVRGGMLIAMAGVLMVLGVVAGLAALFFLPMGVARSLVDERLEVAFRPTALWGAIARVLGEYVAAYAAAIGSLLLAGVVASIPFAGPLLIPLLAYYLLLVVARLFGEICGQALYPPPDPAPRSPAPPQERCFPP